MMVKENQPQLDADIALVFAQPPWGDGKRRPPPGIWDMAASNSGR